MCNEYNHVPVKKYKMFLSFFFGHEKSSALNNNKIKYCKRELK